MEEIGLIIFYIGFFGLFAGIGAMIKGRLPVLKVNNRKQAMLLICLAFILIIVGSQIVGRIT